MTLNSQSINVQTRPLAQPHLGNVSGTDFLSHNKTATNLQANTKKPIGPTQTTAQPKLLSPDEIQKSIRDISNKYVALREAKTKAPVFRAPTEPAKQEATTPAKPVATTISPTNITTPTEKKADETVAHVIPDSPSGSRGSAEKASAATTDVTKHLTRSHTSEKDAETKAKSNNAPSSEASKTVDHRAIADLKSKIAQHHQFLVDQIIHNEIMAKLHGYFIPSHLPLYFDEHGPIYIHSSEISLARRHFSFLKNYIPFTSVIHKINLIKNLAAITHLENSLNSLMKAEAKAAPQKNEETDQKAEIPAEETKTEEKTTTQAENKNNSNNKPAEEIENKDVAQSLSTQKRLRLDAPPKLSSNKIAA